MHLKLVMLLFVTPIFCGCVAQRLIQPYESWDMLGGYYDIKLSDDTYQVIFDGHASVKKKSVIEFGVYRCAELAVSKGYDYFVIVDASIIHNKTGLIATPDKYIVGLMIKLRKGQLPHLEQGYDAHETLARGKNTYGQGSYGNTSHVKMLMEASK